MDTQVQITAAPGGGLQVQGTHTYAAAGTFSAKVTLAGPGCPQGMTATSPVVVTAPHILTREGTAFSGAVIHFTTQRPGASAGDFAASIDWGDGTSPDVVGAAADNSGGFQVSGTQCSSRKRAFSLRPSPWSTRCAGLAGLYRHGGCLRRALYRKGGHSTEVVRAPPRSAVSATFTDPDPHANARDFTALIDWGDGQRSDARLIGRADLQHFRWTRLHPGRGLRDDALHPGLRRRRGHRGGEHHRH